MNKYLAPSRSLSAFLFLLSFVSEGCDCGETLVTQRALLLPSVEQIDFGEVPIGFDVTRVFSVTNEGERKLTVNGFATVPGDAPFEVEGGTVSLRLKDKQEYVLHFRPSVIQVYEANLEILHDGDNAEPVMIKLMGIGIDDQICTSCGGKDPE